MGRPEDLASRLDSMSDLGRTLAKLSDFPMEGPSLAREYPYVPLRSPMLDLADHSLNAASNHCRSLARQIKEIETHLDNQSAIAFWMAGGPSNQVFLPREIYAEDPDRMVFKGVDEAGHPFVLIQHVSQLNIAVRVTKLDKGEIRYPIGFHIPSS